MFGSIQTVLECDRIGVPVISLRGRGSTRVGRYGRCSSRTSDGLRSRGGPGSSNARGRVLAGAVPGNEEREADRASRHVVGPATRGRRAGRRRAEPDQGGEGEGDLTRRPEPIPAAVPTQPCLRRLLNASQAASAHRRKTRKARFIHAGPPPPLRPRPRQARSRASAPVYPRVPGERLWSIALLADGFDVCVCLAILGACSTLGQRTRVGAPGPRAELDLAGMDRSVPPGQGFYRLPTASGSVRRRFPPTVPASRRTGRSRSVCCCARGPSSRRPSPRRRRRARSRARSAIRGRASWTRRPSSRWG